MSSDKELEKIKQEMLKKLMSTPPKTSFWRSGEIMEITDSNFQKVLSEADKPVLLDFWADWCGPCKMMAPIINQMAKEYSNSIYFAKLNVDYNKVTAAQYGVMSIPNFIVFKSGKPVAHTVGSVGKQGLEALIRKAI